MGQFNDYNAQTGKPSHKSFDIAKGTNKIGGGTTHSRTGSFDRQRGATGALHAFTKILDLIRTNSAWSIAEDLLDTNIFRLHSTTYGAGKGMGTSNSCGSCVSLVEEAKEDVSNGAEEVEQGTEKITSKSNPS